MTVAGLESGQHRPLALITGRNPPNPQAELGNFLTVIEREAGTEHDYYFAVLELRPSGGFDRLRFA